MIEFILKAPKILFNNVINISENVLKVSCTRLKGSKEGNSK